MKYLIAITFLALSFSISAQDKGIEIEDYPMKIEWRSDALEEIENPIAETDCVLKTITWIYVDKQFSGGEKGVIERTWMAEDECGNKASTVQYIVLK